MNNFYIENKLIVNNQIYTKGYILNYFSYHTNILEKIIKNIFLFPKNTTSEIYDQQNQTITNNLKENKKLTYSQISPKASPKSPQLCQITLISSDFKVHESP